MKRLILLLLVAARLLTGLSQTSPDMEIVSLTSHFALGNSGMTYIDTVLIQINSRNADTEIRIPYSKGDKVNVDNIWIEDASGNIIRKLRKNDIKDRSSISSISLYEDDFVKYFDLKHDVFPYRIYYTSRINYAKSLNIVDVDHAWSKIPVRHATVIVEVPIKDSVRYKHENVGKPGISQDARLKRYTWQYHYAPPFAMEINAWNRDLKAPSIQVVPLNFKFGETGSFNTWESLGNWVFRLNKNKDKLTPEECRRIDGYLSNAKDDRQKAEILYRYLQDFTRYINVSIKLGGLQTYPASYVCDNKYGDCKALTNYLQAMLKHAGIKSYYTLVEAGTRIPEFDAAFPSQAFNHVILTLPLERDTLFLECTDKNIPFGYLGTFTQGRKALLVDENESRIIQTPALQPEDVLCTRAITVRPEKAVIDLSETQRGYRYELYNYLSKEVAKDEVNAIIRGYIFSNKAELMDYTFITNDRDKAEIGLRAQFKAENIYREYGKNLILPPFPFEVKKFEEPQARTTGIQLDYPEFFRDTITYEIPDKQILNIPEKTTIETSFGKYEHYFERKDDALVCHKYLLLYARQYPRIQYDDFFQFISTVRNNETKNIHLEIH